MGALTGEAKARTLFGGGLVFDGSGSAPQRADVVVEDGRIVDVGPGLDGDTCVDLTGKTLLPGFIDCHVHVLTTAMQTMSDRIATPFSYRFYEAARNLKATLATGVTTIRDASGADRGVQRALQDSLIPGPRMAITIGMISQTGGHADSVEQCGFDIPVRHPTYPGVPRTIADGPVEVRRTVRELVRAGADWIKIAASGGFSSPIDDPRDPHFDAEELEVLVRTATALQRPVMVHAQGAEGIKNAVLAGVKSVEHGVWLDDEAIELMLKHGTWLVPTLLVPVWSLESGRGQAKIDIHATIEQHAESFRRAASAGVRIAMGTDCGIVAHGENLREIALMAERGLSSFQALAAATSGAASLLGFGRDIGTIEIGKRADMVVMEGDLSTVVDLRSRIAAVYRDGLPVILA